MSCNSLLHHIIITLTVQHPTVISYCADLTRWTRPNPSH